jgi:hypothetical protein
VEPNETTFKKQSDGRERRINSSVCRALTIGSPSIDPDLKQMNIQYCVQMYRKKNECFTYLPVHNKNYFRLNRFKFKFGKRVSMIQFVLVFGLYSVNALQRKITTLMNIRSSCRIKIFTDHDQALWPVIHT